MSLNGYVILNTKQGWMWWTVARWDCSLLGKIKQMWRLLMTNHNKSGLNCRCKEETNIAHILFDCALVQDIRNKHIKHIHQGEDVGYNH